jgi:diphthamide biosynthesis enzyme Dph1/Dph2-like protein
MIDSDYDLELERAVNEIKKLACKRSAQFRISKRSAQSPAKRVCIQLPDGLKQKATEIAQELEEKTGAEIFIWLGTCFGACDIPQGLEELGVDLLIQWGHSQWLRTK